MGDHLKYSKGDPIAFYVNGAIAEDEIAWLRKDSGGAYYHTGGDHKLDDGSVVGVVAADGTRTANLGYLGSLESRAAETSETFRRQIAEVRAWGLPPTSR